MKSIPFAIAFIRSIAWMLVSFGQIAGGYSVVYAATSSNSTPTFGTPVASIINLFLALGVVIALAILTIRFLSKRSNVKQKGMIQIVAARQLAPNRSVQVVEFEGRRWMVGVGEQVTLLSELEEDEDGTLSDNLANDKTAFGTLLTDALQSVRSRYIGSREEDGGASGES